LKTTQSSRKEDAICFSKAKRGKSMKAFVMKSIGQVGFMEKPIPQAGPNDAIVKTTRALICTSDSHTVGGAIGPRENLTLGHEVVGVVHEVGSNVKLFKPGDRVLVGAITPDWGDPASQAGHSSQSGAPSGSSRSRHGLCWHPAEAPVQVQPGPPQSARAAALLPGRYMPHTAVGSLLDPSPDLLVVSISSSPSQHDIGLYVV
jgi:NADPH:quinone reductase-like Zn-dependent oxidoreductase